MFASVLIGFLFGYLTLIPHSYIRAKTDSHGFYFLVPTGGAILTTFVYFTVRVASLFNMSANQMAFNTVLPAIAGFVIFILLYPLRNVVKEQPLYKTHIPISKILWGMSALVKVGVKKLMGLPRKFAKEWKVVMRFIYRN